MTVLLIISGITASLAVFNGLYPAITQSSSAVTSASSKLSERIESRIEIIEAAYSGSNVFVWVKNVGTVTVDNISQSDIFFGLDDDFDRIDYGGPATPYWEYQLEGSDTQWRQSATVKITVHASGSLTTGAYLVKVVIPNGIYDETTFAVP